MKNPLKFLTRQYWHDRKQRNLLSTISSAVVDIANYKKAGLLYWWPKQRYYMIEQTLADAYLVTPETWQGFMKMLTFYACDDLTKEARKLAEIEARTKAVRKANKHCATLTSADIARIEREAVANMDADKPVIVEEFDFAIVRADTIAIADATQSNGQLVVVGHYYMDGRLEMALYDEIKHNLQKNEKD